MLIAILLAVALQTASPFQERELAGYRLTQPVFERFGHASRLIAAATRDDPRFDESPLFTRDVAVLGDAPAMAAELDARLRGEPALADALRTAGLTSREYTTFALGLVAARLAHGFVAAGVLRSVPAGVAADNVAFVERHQAEIAGVFRTLGIVD